MMNYQNIDTGCIDDESVPWMPFAPYSDTVMVKYFKADPVRGEVISMLKAPAGTMLPKHHHTGTVIVYTIQGRWKYIEHDWVAGPKSVVFETAASEHTPLAMPDSKEDIITLNVTVGDLLYYDDKGQVCAIENWRTSVDRYLAFCKSKGIAPKDITSFAG